MGSQGLIMNEGATYQKGVGRKAQTWRTFWSEKNYTPSGAKQKPAGRSRNRQNKKNPPPQKPTYYLHHLNKYKMAKQSNEYEKLWQRIIDHIDNIDHIYSREELRKRLDGRQGEDNESDGTYYYLGEDNPVLDIFLGEDGKATETIRENLKTYIRERYIEQRPPKTVDKSLINRAKGVYSEQQKEEVLEELLQETKTNIEKDIKTHKPGIDITDLEKAVDETITPKQIPQYSEAEQAAETTIKIAKTRKDPQQ